MNNGIQSHLKQAAIWAGATLQGDDRLFSGVSTDTRTLSPGTLFVALRGPRHDGHHHIDAAIAAGAAAVMVEQPQPQAIPQLLVDDSRKALARLAAAWRLQMAPTVVGITGSNGKTTVKQMVAAILGQAAPVCATRGNLNNDIGVPLTLLTLSPEHRYAVVEMGANHPGEIAELTALARPDVALLNNAAAAHLAGFGSLEGVARAKGKIFSGLGEGGTAIINADSPFAMQWRETAAGRRILTFGLEQPADVTATWAPGPAGSRIELDAAGTAIALDLPLPGRHNVMNALAATAAAVALDIPAAQIKAGLTGLAPVPGRLNLRSGHRGARIIDDTYNANPASLGAGLEVLAGMPGRRYLVLGDMGELGADESELHAQAGQAARTAGVERLYATGRLSRHAAEAFGEGGAFFADQTTLIEQLKQQLAPDVTVLVKGSRAMHMERVVQAVSAEGSH